MMNLGFGSSSFHSWMLFLLSRFEERLRFFCISVNVEKVLYKLNKLS